MINYRLIDKPTNKTNQLISGSLIDSLIVAWLIHWLIGCQVALASSSADGMVVSLELRRPMRHWCCDSV